MLLKFTDLQSKSTVWVNPEYVVSVLEVPEGESKGQTLIVLLNGQLLVSEDVLDVTGRIIGATTK